MTMRVADYIAQRLAEAGARSVFLLSGGGGMHLFDAIGRNAQLRYCCNHHEQASAIAAEAYARRSGTLGVCCATSGPGATNLLTGLVGAWQDSAPMVCLTGQSKVSQTIRGSQIEGLRQFGTFEVDIVSIVRPVTKYAVFLNDPSSVRYHLEKAIYLATHGRPGPVLLDVPLDIQGARIDPQTLRGYNDAAPPLPSCSAAEMDALTAAIRSAERPLILAGHGLHAAGAVEQFRRVALRLGIPVVTTQLAKDLLPYDAPGFVGHPGVKGDRAGNLAVQRADLILSLGCSLHEQTTGYEIEQFAPQAKKFQVDLDAAILERSARIDSHKIHADATQFLTLLEQRAHQGWADQSAWSAWRRCCRQLKSRYAVAHEPHRIGGEGDPVNFYEFAELLSRQLQGDETIVTDAGSAFYVMGQAFRVKESQRYIVSGCLGAMGYALPAGIGAAAAQPGSNTICVTGDGALQLNIQELQTLRHTQPNVKLFVINNGGYVSIRNTQRTFFDGFLVGCDAASGVSLPCLEKIVRAYDLPYVACPDRRSLPGAVERALSQTGPVVCGIAADPNQQVIPTVTSERLPDGRMRSRPLDEMFPYLDANELCATLAVETT